MHPALALTALGLTAALMAPAALAAPADGDPPEADLAYHGHATLTGTRVTVVLTPWNHGPLDVADATLRLTLSSPPADAQTLPAGCLRSGRDAISCRTGALPAATSGARRTLPLRLAAAPSEVTLTIATAWNGGPADRNPDNNRFRVLVLDTGDTYYF